MKHYRVTYTTKSGRPTEVYMSAKYQKTIEAVMNELQVIHDCTNIKAKPIVFMSADDVLENPETYIL